MQNTKFAREFSVGGGHEGRHFFMARLDEFDFAVSALQRAENAIDAVTRITEKFSHAPRVKPLNKEIANGLRHGEESLE
jgi:hypothetical protein